MMSFFELNQAAESSTVSERKEPLHTARTPPSNRVNNITKQRLEWIKSLGFGENVFVMTENGGIYCQLCKTHSIKATKAGHQQNLYVKEPAYPSRRYKLNEHINSDRHQEALKREVLKESSTIHKSFEESQSKKVDTVAQRFIIVYWAMKEEVANRKIPSLQLLINRVGCNTLLEQFGHCSSTSISEMIQVIGGFIRESIVRDIKNSPSFATLVDETTDISIRQQMIIFARFFKDGAAIT